MTFFRVRIWLHRSLNIPEEWVEPSSEVRFRVLGRLGVSVGDVQDSYLVWATLEMGGDVFAVGWFHDDDKVGPVDEFLCRVFPAGPA